MRIFKGVFNRYSHLYLIIFSLLFFMFIFLSGPVWSQLPNIPSMSGFLGLSFLPVTFPYPQTARITNQQISSIIIGREFPPELVNQKNISFYIQTSSPISIHVEIISKNSQLFQLDIIPEDEETPYIAQSGPIIIPVGNEKLDGQWHGWQLNYLDELLEEFGTDYAFIAKVEIKGEEFCLGPITAFSEDDEGIMETTYLASFTNERDDIKDYGWASLTPVICEYNELIELDYEIIEEGYVCLTPGQKIQQSQVPKIPVNFISPPLGPGPFLPVTIFSSTLSNMSYPFAYPPSFVPSRLPSQFYSTPINPVLAYSLIQSIPLYLDAQTGLPYSVNKNLLQFYDQIPTYPTRIDYSNDPTYAYLGLNDPANILSSESAGWLVPQPYYP